MNEEYLKTIAEKIQLEINKTDIKCYGAKVFIKTPYNGQILFLLRKNNKKYKSLHNVFDNENIELLTKFITENILLNVKKWRF